MRSDEEILRDRGNFLDKCDRLRVEYKGDSGYILEVLLDIRDLLLEQKRKKKGSRKSVPTPRRKNVRL